MKNCVCGRCQRTSRIVNYSEAVALVISTTIVLTASFIDSHLEAKTVDARVGHEFLISRPQKIEAVRMHRLVGGLIAAGADIFTVGSLFFTMNRHLQKRSA